MVRILALVSSVLAFTSAFIGSGQQNPIPEKFTNLQVLPKDITRPQLVAIMKSFCFDLDIRCQHCHVGEGNDLSKFDFASDAKPTKATARQMLRMTSVINGELLKGVGDPARAPKVTCYTCHRAATKPLTVAPGGGGGLLPSPPG